MIHPLTIITFAAFLGSGLYVFQTKEAVRKLDQELRAIRTETEELESSLFTAVPLIA